MEKSVKKKLALNLFIYWVGTNEQTQLISDDDNLQVVASEKKMWPVASCILLQVTSHIVHLEMLTKLCFCELKKIVNFANINFHKFCQIKINN